MKQRLLSLDAFRGFTIAAMLLVNNPGSWDHVYRPLLHAPWHGLTFTDWIFPFFVFISGLAMGLGMSREGATGARRWQLLGQAQRRGATLVLIGLALNFVPAMDLSTLRVPGVLQRLGLCAMLVSPIVLWCGWRGRLAWALALLAVYAAVQLLVPVPDVEGVVRRGALQPGQDVGAWLDRLLMGGHLWKGGVTWDPEGGLSTLPALSSMLFGVLAAAALRTGAKDAGAKDAGTPGLADRAMGLVVAGLVCLWLGQVLDAWLMPINKNLWTPAYVFATTGWALLLFAAFHWLLDGPPGKHPAVARVAHPLVVFGMNALFLFVLSILLAKGLAFVKLADGRTLKAALHAPLAALPVPPELASLFFACGFVLAMYGVAWALWRRGWFVKV